MKKNKWMIKKKCMKCNHVGNISDCCSSELYGNRCGGCHKFCSSEVCNECRGSGYISFFLNKIYKIFVCIFSSKEVKRLYKPKKYKDMKEFECKIVNIMDNNNVKIMVGEVGKTIIVEIDDLFKK